MTACNYVVFQGTGWASANDETEMNWCKPSTACLKYFFLGGGGRGVHSVGYAYFVSSILVPVKHSLA